MLFELEPDTFSNMMKRVTFHGGRHIIYATESIDLEAANRLKVFVAAHKIETGRIRFNSPGGSLIGGMKLGEAIRELGFDTEVGAIDHQYGDQPTAICASACAYAFAGGVNRYFSTQSGRLGLHQFSSSADQPINAGTAQIVSGELVKYLKRMGVDADAFALASLTDQSDMAWLSDQSAEILGLANNGVQPTTAEIKLRDGVPYLRMEQHFDDVTSRVLLLYDNSHFEIMAGIVTSPQLSVEKLQSAFRSYLEFDSDQYASIAAPSGMSVNGSVLWLERTLEPFAITKLQSDDRLGMWTENGGVMRWGTCIDLRPIRSIIREFVANCK